MDHRGSSSSLCHITGSRSSKKNVACYLVIVIIFCTDLLSLGVLELVKGREGALVSSCFQSQAWGCVEIRCSGRVYQRKEKHPGLSWDLASGSNKQILWILTHGYRKEAVSAQVSKGPVSGCGEGTLGGVEGQIVGVQRGQGKGEPDTLEALSMEPQQKEPEAQLEVEMEFLGTGGQLWSAAAPFCPSLWFPSSFHPASGSQPELGGSESFWVSSDQSLGVLTLAQGLQVWKWDLHPQSSRSFLVCSAVPFQQLHKLPRPLCHPLTPTP